MNLLPALALNQYMVHRLVLIIFALTTGCDNGTNAPRPATTTTSTQPVLRPVELHYGIYLAALDLRITVDRDGVLRSVRTDNKGRSGGPYGTNERVEVRAGKLTAGQVGELANLFNGWDSLSTTPYGGLPDGGDLTIRYGDKTVSGGSAVPKQVEEARIHLMELARSMPLANP